MAKPGMLQHITIGRLETALQDLLSKRAPALQSFAYGAFVVTELTDLQGKIGALPPAAKSKPFAADLTDRETANLLRNDAVGVLNEARRQLRRAQKKDASLPGDLEAQVFAWFDDLEKTSAAEAAEAKKKGTTEPTPA